MFKFIGFLNVLLVFNTKLKYVKGGNDVLLAEDLFVNLYSDPFLEKDGDLSEVSKQYIDEKVNRFLGLMKEKDGINHSLEKRSLKKHEDRYVLDGLKPLNILKNKNYIDAIIFGNETSYLATLEQNQNEVKLELFIYNVTMESIFEENVLANKLYGISNRDGTFLIVVETSKVNIFQIKGENIRKVQTLEVELISDISLWNNKYGFFMAVATNKTHLGFCNLYKWFGRHFDLVDELQSIGASSIEAFTIGSSEFIAVGNFQNEFGQKEIFSYIFKYNLDSERYEINQKIVTYGIKKLTFISFFEKGLKEDFLVVVNFNKENNKNSLTTTIYKFIDDYFMPYEGFNLNQPKEIVVISSPNQNKLLGIFTQRDGLKIYSYDGWMFKQINFNTDILKTATFIKISTFLSNILMIQKPTELIILEITFTKETSLKTIEDEIMTWCQDQHHLIDFKTKTINKHVVQATFGGNINETETDHSELSGRQSNDDESDFLESLQRELSNDFRTLREINENISKTIESTPKEIILNSNLIVDELIINGMINLNELQTKEINNNSIGEILSNKIDLNSLNNLEKFKFEDVLINNLPEFLNNQKSDLLNLNNIQDLKEIIVNGNVLVENNTNIEFLNNVKVSKSNLFINGLNQNFNETFKVDNLKANNVTIIGRINNKTCEDKIRNIKINKVENLNVTNLNISGFINKLNFANLTNLALLSTGNQNVSETIYFDSLTTNEININNEGNENSIFNQLINIIDGEYKLESIDFDDVEINELEVVDNLNDIKVIDGNLDILRKNYDQVQEVFGEKVFENENSIQQSKILNSSDEMISIKDSIEIINDVIITHEDLKVRNLNVSNIKSDKLIFGLGDLESAFKLDEELENNSFIFKTIQVDNINTSSINDISINDLVKNQDCFITGYKTIDSDLYINGNSKISRINEVDLEEFNEEVLTISGDQVLNGDYFINKLTSDSVSSSNIYIGETSWNEIPQDNQINATIEVDTIEIKKSHIENLITTNLNEINLKNLLEQSFKNDSNLSGNITFNKVYAKNVNCKNVFNTNDIPHLIEQYKTNFIIEDNLIIDELNVENIKVGGFINHIKADSFEKHWMEDSDEHEFDNNEDLNNVTILGKGEVIGEFNGFNLEELFRNVVKTDEDHEFDDVTFEEPLISLDVINLDGNIVGLDLDSAVTLNKDQKQEISGLKTFESSVFINGSLILKGNINDLNIEDICGILSKEKNYHLIINGNAIFPKGPTIESVNNKSLIQLINNVWFKNRPTQLNGYFKLENASFENDINLRGLLNTIDLEYLSTNYFSKTKNQTISSHLDFTTSVNFFDGLTAEEMLLDDTISGVRLKDIISKALLDGYIQVFDETLIGDEIFIDELNGEYLLNDFDLQRQVMRYDLESVIIGNKEFSNLTIKNLIISENSLVQDVNIIKWFEESVLKSGGSLENVIFENDVYFNQELSVVGNVNGKKFNNQTVLLNNLNQTILGNFEVDSNVNFNDLKIKYLNGVDFDSFINEIVSFNESTTINSEITFNSPLNVNNLEFKKLYNGVNVTNLLNNLTSFHFENYHENYTQLLNVTRQIQYSLENFQEYLHHYEQIQVFNNVIYADLFNGHLVTIISFNNYHFYHLYFWNESRKGFKLIHEGVIPNIENIVFIEKIINDDKSCLYVEDNLFGYISELTEENAFELVEKLNINNTNSIHNFKIVEKNIYCSLFTSDFNPQLYCKEKDTFRLIQTFAPINQASSLVMNGETFIITSSPQETENYVTIWQYNKHFGRFGPIQHIYVASPCSITAISFKNAHYLAIASSSIEGAIYSGSVQIKWFHPNLEMFVSYQSINTNSPRQVEFSILPSKELILYVLTHSGSLLVYEHEGIFGFNLKNNLNSNANKVKLGDMNREHIILASGPNQMKVVRGIFKKHTYG